MKLDWLWDRNISEKAIKKIFSNDRNSWFVVYAALLLSRKNTPKEVFDNYLGQKVFVKNWPRIKRHMRKDNWNDVRIIFWQAVYDKLRDDFKEKGIPIRKPIEEGKIDECCRQIGETIRKKRKEIGLTQHALAEKLGISQQIISRIEGGKDNISLLTLKRVAQGLESRVVVELR